MFFEAMDNYWKKRFPHLTAACESSRYFLNIVKTYLTYLPLSLFYYYICRVKINLNELKQQNYV